MAKKQRKAATRKTKRPLTGTPQAGPDKVRIDVTGITNVYTVSGKRRPSGDATLQPLGTWGQADRGPQGYYDTGPSEIIPQERFTKRETASTPKRASKRGARGCPGSKYAMRPALSVTWRT